jgi:hypothetical protein
MFLQQDGDYLRGTITDSMRGDVRLRGSVTGNLIRFSTEYEMRGSTVRSEYTGTLVGSRLRGTVTTRIIETHPGLDRGSRNRRVRFADWTAQRVGT